MSIMRAVPISRGTRTEPPPPTKMPRVPSGQRVIGRSLCDADVRRGRKLEPAADHCAVQDRHDRNLAEFDAVEGPVPGARMRNTLRDIAFGQFAEIEAGGKMLAFGGEDHRLDPFGQRVEERLDAENGRIVERIALVRALQAAGWRCRRGARP